MPVCANLDRYALKTAEKRLRFYASQFNTIEVDSTYYALVSQRNAELWAERTPPGLRDADAASSGHGAAAEHESADSQNVTQMNIEADTAASAHAS